jgi:Zn-dependent protease with chaperone function
MIRLQGFWFDGKVSHKSIAYMLVDSEAVKVFRANDHSLICESTIDQFEISSRVGNTPRYFYLASGEKFETSDNAAADNIVRQHKPSIFRTLAHTLESHLGFVALTLVIVVSLTWAGIKYGLPAASHTIAMALPQNIMDQAAEETLVLLDKLHFEPSKLPEDVQAKVLKHFDAAIQENKHLNIKVLFRDGQAIGANAFALPDGTVIFTDQIVELADNYDELLAVLAHEIGHVEHRHSLRGVIQASALSFAIAMLAGDVSAMGDLLVNLPIMLTTSAYSRNFEREADDHSLIFLDKHNIPRHSFIDLMSNLSKDHQCRYLLKEEFDFFWDSEEDEQDEDKKDEDKKDEDKTAANKQAENDKQDEVSKKDDEKSTDSGSLTRNEYEKMSKLERREFCHQLIAKENAKGEDSALDDVLDYFSSHPATEERLEKFRKKPSP